MNPQNEVNVTLRPVQQEDEALLLELYASTRAEELSRVPWSAEQKDAFVRMQFLAQKQHYAAEYPQASHDVVCLNGASVGRLYLDRGAEKFHILDVTILPRFRGSGVGTAARASRLVASLGSTPLRLASAAASSGLIVRAWDWYS